MESYDFNLVFLFYFCFKTNLQKMSIPKIYQLFLSGNVYWRIGRTLDRINVDLCLLAAHLRGSQKLYSIIIGTAEMKIHFWTSPLDSLYTTMLANLFKCCLLASHQHYVLLFSVSIALPAFLPQFFF